MLGTGSETEERMISGGNVCSRQEGASPASLPHGTAFQSQGGDLCWGWLGLGQTGGWMDRWMGYKPTLSSETAPPSWTDGFSSARAGHSRGGHWTEAAALPQPPGLLVVGSGRGATSGSWLKAARNASVSSSLGPVKSRNHWKKHMGILKKDYSLEEFSSVPVQSHLVTRGKFLYLH